MDVIQYAKYGPPEDLEVVGRPRPEPGPGQLLLRPRVISVNPIDWKIMSGSYRLVVPVKRPAVPCFDACGVVEEVGEGVEGFSVGDRVFVRNDVTPGGVAAELALISAEVTARAPEGVDDAQLAGIPLAGMTALQGLRAVGALEEGERVLVIGASGGVGHLAVQLAAAAGARVTGVCSTRNVEFVRGLGAEDVIDYTAASDDGGPYDAVLDCVGVGWGRMKAALTSTGHAGTVVPFPSHFARRAILPLYSKRRLHVVMMTPNAADLDALGAHLAAGSLRVEVEQTFEGLEGVRGALAHSMSGRTRGKIVVALQEPTQGARRRRRVVGEGRQFTEGGGRG
jgi:NADPH:quinone reductase-like Zn-dependent oxidoreductase